jgi:uncharacterized membrane protein
MKQLSSEEPQRIQSVDILRGLVMVLMAIDHVRVYAGVPAGGITADLFFTRWVTHYCAPAFAFFAGTSAFLYGQKIKDNSQLMKFLLTRGLLLVILELTLVRFFWTFSLDYSSFILAGVIWMLGWCMVLLSFFVRLQARSIGIIGVLIITFQQVFSFVPKLFPESIQSAVGSIWEFFYPANFEPLGGISVLYVLIPWIGVMMAGYGFGLILLKKQNTRDKICISLGLSAILVFLIIGSIIVYYDNTPDNPMPKFFRLLNQKKYPPSQLYVLMTLGPIIALVPLAERAKGWLINALAVFGRVPMFYYLIHILLIHISALVVNYLREGAVHQEWYTTAPFAGVPETSRWSLSILYLVFVIDVAILYVKCRWYYNYKKAHPEKAWLKYL